MNKAIALLANIHILKPLCEILKEKGYQVTQQLPVLTLPIIKQLASNSPEIIFISEEVDCDDDLTVIEAISLIKAQSNPRFIIQTRPRKIGDNFLSDLVSLVVYDFLPKSEFDIEELLNLIEHPRDYQQVKDYHNLTRRIFDLPLDELPKEETGEVETFEEKNKSLNLRDWLKNPFKLKGQPIKIKPKVIPEKPKGEVVREKVMPNVPKVLRPTENPFYRPKLLTNSRPVSDNPIREANAKRLQQKEEPQKVTPQPKMEIEKKQLLSEKNTSCIITVVGTKPNVGCTTVAVNLLRYGGILITKEKRKWTSDIEAEYLDTFQKVEEKITEVTAKYRTVVIDAGQTHDITELNRVSNGIVVVSDNRKDANQLLTKLYEKVPLEKSILAVNKAIPSGGISPKDLSEGCKIPIGIVLPIQSGYGKSYGLDLSNGPWEVFLKKLSVVKED